MYYDKSSTGAKAYLALAGEVLRKNSVDKKSTKETVNNEEESIQSQDSAQ